MALGGIILYLQFQNSASSSGSVSPLLFNSSDPFSFEFRVRFPASSNTTMVPTELSGALVTLSSGSTASKYLSLWYEKPSATSMTGNLFLTSSAGRITMASGTIFDDSFCNLTVVKDTSSGSMTLYATRYESNELVFASSSFALSGAVGFPFQADCSKVELGSSALVPSRGQFWGQEFRLWRAALNPSEIMAHAAHFESYGREVSYNNKDLAIHWRLADGSSATAGGAVYVADSTSTNAVGTGSNFTANTSPFTKFLLDYAYVPGIDYGWNQEKVRVYDGSTIDPQDAYQDERFISLEFNMYDALNEDISHIMTSYEELNSFIGLPVNKYRDDYEGLRQMRETYFKRLQGSLNFTVFVDMLDFFDSSFVSIVEKIIPARALFKGDELVVESHMLERPKYQYQLRPINEGLIDISGSISVVDYGDDFE